MQAITTTYHGPTNTRGSRITARCDAGKIAVPYDCSRNIADNHEAAAAALLRKLGWEYTYVGGTTHTGQMVWVAVHGSPIARA